MLVTALKMPPWRRDDGHDEIPASEELEVLAREGARVHRVAHEETPRSEPEESRLGDVRIVVLLHHARAQEEVCKACSADHVH